MEVTGVEISDAGLGGIGTGGGTVGFVFGLLKGLVANLDAPAPIFHDFDELTHLVVACCLVLL